MNRANPGSWQHEFRASLAFAERNLNLVKRYFSWEVVFLLYTVVNTLTIGLIAVQSGGSQQQVAARVLYLVVGALLWSFLSLLFNEVAHSVAWERWEGTIEYTFMAPVRRFTYLSGMCIYATIYGLIRTGIVLVAVIFFFHLKLEAANIAAALVLLLCSSLSFIGMGLMAAVLPLISPERGEQATNIVQALILLVSGVYYDTSVLPGWLQPLSIISPATYTLRGVRAALLQGASLSGLAPTIAIVLGFGVVFVPLGLWVFHLGEEYTMRAGKLKRSG